MILGIDTSSIVSTIALLTENKLIAEYTVNSKKNHSEKMMQVLDTVLKESFVNLEDIAAIAVAKGPGSFTGIRIGMATAQGIAHALKKPMIGINSLDGLAYNFMGEKRLICPVVNAQRGDVYTSLYRWEGEQLKQIEDYKIINAQVLIKELENFGETIMLGDGVPVIKKVCGDFSKIVFAHPNFSMPRASSIAAAGLYYWRREGRLESCFDIEPFYIRKSNAEEKWEEKHGREN